MNIQQFSKIKSNTTYALTNGIIYTNYATLSEHAILIENNIIKTILAKEQIPDNILTIDVARNNISPGFIDLQVNGCGGVMFNDSITPHSIKTMYNANLKSGCTSFLPTLITTADKNLYKAVELIKALPEQYKNKVLGLHLEGPFISHVKKGIHNANYIQKPNSKLIDYLCKNANFIKIITIAPENSNPKIIKKLTNAGIVVSIGHSNANYNEAMLAINAGATKATHLFNAMSSITGREPGVVGAIYDSPIYAGVIADGFHVDYANIRIAKKIKQEKLILITDATAAANSKIIDFDFVGEKIFVKDGKCLNSKGTLGGSALTMNKAILNVIENCDISLEEAIKMATLYPAKAIGVDKEIGAIKEGMQANLTIFNNKLEIIKTII